MNTTKFLLSLIFLFTCSIAFTQDFSTEPASLDAPKTQCDCCHICEEKECPQANCEEEDKKDGPWENTFSFGYNKTNGNSDTSLLNTKIMSLYDQDKDQITLSGEYNFGDTDNETNVDYTKGLAEYKKIMTDLLYRGIGATYLRDGIADVKYRAIINPAIGYYFYKTDLGFFNVEAGPSYLFEEVGGISDDYLAPRIGDRLEYQITDTAKIFQLADVILSAEDSSNYLIQSEAGIETAISEGLSLIFKVRDNYDNRPAAGNKKNDIALMTAIGVDF